MKCNACTIWKTKQMGIISKETYSYITYFSSMSVKKNPLSAFLFIKPFLVLNTFNYEPWGKDILKHRLLVILF